MSEKTVREHYNITDEDMDILKYLADTNIYWEEAHGFLSSRLDNRLSWMSESQIAWVEKILEVIQR